MTYPDGRRIGDALRPDPGRACVPALVERDVMARRIARGADRQRIEVSLGQVLLQPFEVDGSHQQRLERRVVEQRSRCLADQPAEADVADPAPGVAQRTADVRTVDLRRLDVAPDRAETSNGAEEVVGAGSQRRGIQRAGRGPADDPERIGSLRPPRLEQDPANPQQRADLVGGAGAAARQYQPDRSGHAQGHQWRVGTRVRMAGRSVHRDRIR